jgi:hypothetical protein
VAESFTHVKLVKELIDWVRREHDQVVVLADTSIFPVSDRPPRIGGYVPDLYARVALPTRLVLGEAKTRLDLENEHTAHQLVAFLNYCHLHPGAQFVMAVPWDMSRFAGNLLKRIAAERGFSKVPIAVKGCFVD